MTCAERRDLLLLYAAGALEPAERDELRAHLATGCPACAGALAEAEAIVAQAAGAIAPVPPPAGTLDKLMARIADAPARPNATPMRIAPRNRFLAPLLAAAAAVAVTSGVFLYANRDALRLWRAADVTSVALASPTQPSAKGTVLWDREHGKWRVTVAQLAAAPAGREYELWFIPKDGKPIASKAFGVDAAGKASFVVEVPPGVGDGAVAAITDEPLGGLPAPTGKVHLAGTFN